MANFELVETGLTADKFIDMGAEQSAAPRSDGRGAVAEIHEQRLRRSSLLRAQRGVMDCLSVRGLNFVNAIVEMNGGCVLDVRFLEVQPYQVAVEGWRHEDSPLIRYHLVCESSRRAHVRSGDERLPLNAGDLFRVVHDDRPTIFHGGEAGSLHLVVTLDRPQARPLQAGDTARPSIRTGPEFPDRAMRWGAHSEPYRRA